MKKIFTLLPIVLMLCFNNASAQIFWVENFEGGSTSGLLAGAYTGPNGIWVTNSTGTNDATNNTWFVSCAENGHTTGGCGTGCVGVSTTATLSTLHIGSNPAFGGDGGASYNAGGFCPSIMCVTTNMRAESPTIDCSSRTGVTLNFYYTEAGDGAMDDASVWYYDGSTWALLVNPAKTPPICPGGQGYWDYLSVALPSSADNNPNVKIGFNWTNNDDGLGSDPSFAVDSVYLTGTLSALPVPVASFTSTDDTLCQDSCITLTNTSTSTGTIDSFRWSVVGFPLTLPNISPLPLCLTSSIPPGPYIIRLDAFGGGSFDSATKMIFLKKTPRPVITKAGHVLSITGAYTNIQWYNGSSPIAGATNSTYTYSLTATYKVTADSGGCKGTSVALAASMGIPSVNGAYSNDFWLAQGNGDIVTLHAAESVTEDLVISIAELSGREVSRGTWNRGTDTKQVTYNNLAPGLYMIKISGNNTSSVLKWMKQ